MADFITSGPIGFSGSYPGSVYSFVSEAGGSITSAGGISLSNLYASANTAEISLSGSATYASPYRMYNFYGMSTTACDVAADTIAIGIPYAAGGALEIGSAQVLDWSGSSSSWVQRGSDFAGNSLGDWFGYDVSLSQDANTVGISAPYVYGSAATGYVEVYDWGGASWAQRGNSISGLSHSFGFTISLAADGDTIAATSGAVARVYDWDSASWVQRSSDIGSQSTALTQIELSADGDVIVLGAPLNDDGGANAGQVQVYEWNSTSWVQRGSDLNGDAAGDRFGSSVSVSPDGTAVAISADQYPGPVPIFSHTGYVQIYDWNSTSWVQRGSDLNGDAAGDRFGSSVSLSADLNTVAVSAGASDDGGANAGQVQVYDWSGASWVQRGSSIAGPAASDIMGWTTQGLDLSSDGNSLVIGNASDDGGSNAGQVQVYDWNVASWVQRGSDLDGDAANQYFGHGVSFPRTSNPCSSLCTPPVSLSSESPMSFPDYISGSLCGRSDWTVTGLKRCDGTWFTEGVESYVMVGDGSGPYLIRTCSDICSDAVSWARVIVTLDGQSIEFPVTDYYSTPC